MERGRLSFFFCYSMMSIEKIENRRQSVVKIKINLFSFYAQEKQHMFSKVREREHCMRCFTCCVAEAVNNVSFSSRCAF